MKKKIHLIGNNTAIYKVLYMTEGCNTMSFQNYDMATITILQLTLLKSVTGYSR